MPTYRFQEIWRPAEQSGKCPVCGKRTVRRTKFSQTLNPFNRNADGEVKTADEIRAELKLAVEAWTPDFHHAACKERLDHA